MRSAEKRPSFAKRTPRVARRFRGKGAGLGVPALAAGCPPPRGADREGQARRREGPRAIDAAPEGQDAGRDRAPRPFVAPDREAAVEAQREDGRAGEDRVDHRRAAIARRKDREVLAPVLQSVGFAIARHHDDGGADRVHARRFDGTEGLRLEERADARRGEDRDDAAHRHDARRHEGEAFEGTNREGRRDPLPGHVVPGRRLVIGDPGVLVVGAVALRIGGVAVEGGRILLNRVVLFVLEPFLALVGEHARAVLGKAEVLEDARVVAVVAAAFAREGVGQVTMSRSSAASPSSRALPSSSPRPEASSSAAE